MATYSADLLHVHDGDTFRFRVHLGFGIQSEHNIRLLGVNAPELSTPAGATATQWVAAWFAAHPGPYIVQTHGAEIDKYGRYLAQILAPDGACLSSDLLAAGMGMVYP
jgi:endonuclease YncB( thermonuclease family)